MLMSVLVRDAMRTISPSTRGRFEEDSMSMIVYAGDTLRVGTCDDAI